MYDRCLDALISFAHLQYFQWSVRPDWLGFFDLSGKITVTVITMKDTTSPEEK